MPCPYCQDWCDTVEACDCIESMQCDFDPVALDAWLELIRPMMEGADSVTVAEEPRA